MKINEKNLCAYAVSSTSAVDKEGYLMKKGEVNKGFQKRWFVLKGNLLFYFEKRLDKEPLGVIILEGCTIELDENDAQFSFKIVFHGIGNRSYVLCAESQESMEQWMKSLACASYDYMKLMVTDLQRQLKETRNNKIMNKKVESTCVNSTFPENISVPQDINDGEKYYSLNPNLQTSHQTTNSSPHPPPRNKQNLHHRTQLHVQSIPNSSQGVPSNLSKSDTINNVNSIPTVSSNNYNSFFSFISSRNKIIFKDIHTAYGRPVLRDRNEWRYKRRETDNIKSVHMSSNKINLQHIEQQNLLISL